MEIDVALVGRLIAAQYPRWANLPIRRVQYDGWDNCTFRLGDELLVRLPSEERYSAQVSKEQAWLPRLAPHLPLPIPEPVALGTPGYGYPWHWSVYRWLEGDSATHQGVGDLKLFAVALAEFLAALHKTDPTGGPEPGAHNFFRGGPLAIYDAETRFAIKFLHGKLDTHAALSVWQAALETTWQAAPVWIHGDVTASNLLVKDGRLCAVIDFGSCGVGDPACDLVIAWTLLDGESREAFLTALTMDEATWTRARGWALWKTLITLAEETDTNSTQAIEAQRVLKSLLSN